jgi:hypothetical protein
MDQKVESEEDGTYGQRRWGRWVELGEERRGRACRMSGTIVKSGIQVRRGKDEIEVCRISSTKRVAEEYIHGNQTKTITRQTQGQI